MQKIPIIYVRGYAGTQADVEETVDDPFYGFNLGSTHVRVDEQGRADFYVFESPFVRLLTDHGYVDVYDGAVQVATDCPTPQQTIWIYRFYDPTSKTYDRPGGRRLSIEQVADGLREFIEDVKQQTGAPRVVLLAHSMGGLVCRSLIQKIYPDRNEHAPDHVDKLFTYGTPHGGIHFERGSGAIERVRDAIGANNSDDFGRQRIYEYVTPKAKAQATPPPDFREDEIPPEAFDVDRVFCIVGTNAHDYDVAHGLSRALVGPQSDGLVQIQSAAVRGAHRAFIHRSHSGRYGMVNSDEGYQNLQRFLFGDVRVKMVLCDFALDFTPPANDPDAEVTYQFELQVAIKGLPIVMHERRVEHFSAVSLNIAEYERQKALGLPLFTNFLMAGRRADGTVTYMLRMAVFKQQYRKGIFMFRDHIERLPVWSDYLVVSAKPSPSGDGPFYEAKYSWASKTIEPEQAMELVPASPVQLDALVPLPERGRSVLGPNARIRFETTDWV
jgi:hypothetical protein